MKKQKLLCEYNHTMYVCRGSSSSSTDSLASWSSREARDREGEVRPAGLGEGRPAGVNSNGEEGRRIAPLGETLKTFRLQISFFILLVAVITMNFRARERSWGPSGRGVEKSKP